MERLYILFWRCLISISFGKNILRGSTVLGAFRTWLQKIRD
jgi:hypothetical protein